MSEKIIKLNVVPTLERAMREQERRMKTESKKLDELGTIENAIPQEDTRSSLKKSIKQLADKYSSNLNEKIVQRQIDMQSDDNSHYLIYRVLGISYAEGELIDQYQNTGRFLYKYAGSFLEEASTICLRAAYPQGKKIKIPNHHGQKPKTFEIDFLNGTDAIEIKWRDATTDGDHITKEHTRVKAIATYGYKPIRVMFYYPQRDQAKRIQESLKAIYRDTGGEYYAGDEAWDYIKKVSGYDLKEILVEIAAEAEKE